MFPYFSSLPLFFLTCPYFFLRHSFLLLIFVWFFERFSYGLRIRSEKCTIPETDIFAPENGCLEDEIPFGAKGLFSGAKWLLVFGEGIPGGQICNLDDEVSTQKVSTPWPQRLGKSRESSFREIAVFKLYCDLLVFIFFAEVNVHILYKQANTNEPQNSNRRHPNTFLRRYEWMSKARKTIYISISAIKCILIPPKMYLGKLRHDSWSLKFSGISGRIPLRNHHLGWPWLQSATSGRRCEELFTNLSSGNSKKKDLTSLFCKGQTWCFFGDIKKTYRIWQKNHFASWSHWVRMQLMKSKMGHSEWVW